MCSTPLAQGQEVADSVGGSSSNCGTPLRPKRVGKNAHLVPDFDMFAISSDDGRLIVPDDEQLEFYWDKPQDGRTNVHGGLAERGGRL